MKKGFPGKLRKFLFSLGLLLFMFFIAAYFFLAQGKGVSAPGLVQNESLRTPGLIRSEAGVTSTEISVLTYNIAGLPWPIACGKHSRDTDANGDRIPIACNRASAAGLIGDMLETLRQEGKAPDIVFLQEAFIAGSAEVVIRGGYTNWVTGPGRNEPGPEYSSHAKQSFLDARGFKSGEKFGKRLSSGLTPHSRHKE